MKNHHHFIRLILSLVLLLGIFGCSSNDFENFDDIEPDENNEEIVDELTDSTFESEQEAITEPKVSPLSDDQSNNTWTILLYQDADDETLEEDIFYDLNEAERVGSTDKVNIVAQIDRYDGGFDGDGDWYTTRRYLLTQDDDLEVLSSQVLEDLGEVNMANGDTLADFAIWGIENYPAGHYALILSDHGAGWPGGWTDGDYGKEGDGAPETNLAENFGDMIYLDELEDALLRIKEDTGVQKFDLIGFDACLMAQVEVLAAVQPYAKTTVFSEETEPSLGWAYTAFLTELVDDPSISAIDLAKSIVETYIEEDQMIVDDQARERYAERAYGEKNMTAEEVSIEETKSITLTAVNLEAAPVLWEAIDSLALTLPEMDNKTVAAARKYARSFENVFSDTSSNGDPYIDLGGFAKVIINGPRPDDVIEAANGLIDALNQVIIAEKHGEQKRGAMGLTVYFPNAKLFKAPESGYEIYTSTARSFSSATLWDEYLTYYYTGQPIEQDSQGPEQNVDISAPGSGEMKIDPLELSSDSVREGEPTTLSTIVTGDSIGYLYIFSGYYDKESNAVQVIDIDYIDSEVIKDVDGMVYPDWQEEGQVTIEIDWEPYLFLIDDGETQAQALLYPDTFGVDLAETVYSTSGMYLADGEEEARYARLYFDGDGNQVKLVVFTSEDDQGAVREVLPSEGDQFTVLETWYDLNSEESEVISHEGETLTFGAEPFTWTSAGMEETDLTGMYLLGIIAEDLEGEQVEEYVEVTVE